MISIHAIYTCPCGMRLNTREIFEDISSVERALTRLALHEDCDPNPDNCRKPECVLDTLVCRLWDLPTTCGVC
jgi:hypothetical protein